MFPSSSHQPLLLVILLATGGGSLSSLMVHSLATTTPTSPPILSPSALRFFIGGLGYCGNRIADRLRLEFPDYHISGCVRSETSKQRLLATTTSKANNNVAIHVLDLDQEYSGLDQAGLDDLARATHIIQTIAPIADFDRDPLLALHSQTLLASSSSSSSGSLQWVGYLSSTGVYGDYGGDWVDEDSDLKCQDTKSLARVQAEKEWRDLETKTRQQQEFRHIRVDVFRCGGIYGPGRGPLSTALARLETGTFSIPDEEISDKDESSSSAPPKYVNRILVDDICGAIVAAVKANCAGTTTVSAQSPSTSILTAGGIYNLVDDDPAPRRHVIDEANRLVHSTFPNKMTNLQTTTPSLSSSSSSTPVIQNSLKRPMSRNTGNKRCKNQRLKDAFQWKLLAPTFREGLRICLESYDMENKEVQSPSSKCV